MRILLDECLPKRLKRDLVGHHARTVPEMGWASKTNGELLALAEAGFDVFLTVDRNLSFNTTSLVSVWRSWYSSPRGIGIRICSRSFLIYWLS